MLNFEGTPPPLDSFLEDKPKNSQLKALQKGFLASLSNFSSWICIGNSNNKLPSFHFPGFCLDEGEGFFAVDLICRSFHTGIKY
ncbi:unnamed protein product [Sphagnum troendelagicum]